MAFSPSFQISQTPTNPALVIALDDSSGSDVLIVARRITLTDANGNTLVTDGTTTTYNEWPLVTNPISLDVLEQDTAVVITVDWVNNAGVAIYTLSQKYCLVSFNKAFLYYLVQQQSLTPGIVQDSNYFSNLCTFYTTIVGAENAVTIGGDIAASQNMLNIGTNMRNNQSLYF